MLEIRTDISSLTKDQREQLAGFILTFDMPRQAELPFTQPVAGDVKITHHVAEVHLSDESEAIMNTVAPLANSEKFVVTEEWVNGISAAPFPSPEAVFGVQYEHVADTVTVPVPPPPPAVISPAGPHLVIGSVAIDKSGLPWDERIHSSSKALTAEGLWRKKRGVGDTTAVESALRQLPVAPPPPPVPAPTPPAISSEGKALYIKLIGDTTAAVGAKKATQEDFKSIALNHGVPSIPLLIQHLDKIQAVADDCYALIASRG